MRKRLLLALLTVVLVFGLVASASAATFSDIADSVAQGDIQKLNALGIIDGYPDGTFKPDGDITRAEFAKIAVIMAGLEDSAAFLQNSASQFGDVAAGQWYTGWVNVAASQGIIKGYPDGTFQPQANISGAEAVTILVRLLGYDDRLPGTWPVNYMAKAGELGITKDVAFNAATNATRGVVCQLASATLEEELVNYSKDVEDFVAKTVLDENGEKATITLLAQKFDSYLTKKVLVTEVRLSDEKFVADIYVPAKGKKSAKINEITFAENVVVAGALNIFGLEGRFIDYIENDDDEVVSVTVKNYKVVFGEVDKDYSLGDNKIELKDAKYSVADYCYNEENSTYFVYVDGANIAEYNGLSQVTEAIETINAKQYVTLFFNDDNKVAYITWSRTAGDVVDKVTADKGRVTFKDPRDGKAVERRVDLDIDDDDYLVMRNGQVVDLDDLQENDIVYVATKDNENARGYDFIIKAVYNPVKGDYTKQQGSNTHIDGKKYKAAYAIRVEDKHGDKVDDNDITELLGDEVVAHLNANGLIRYITGTVTGDDTKPVVLVDAGVVHSYGDTSWIKVFTTNGKLVTYDIEDDYYDDNKDKIAATVGQKVYQGDEVPGDAKNGVNYGKLIKVYLNSDGEVDKIKAAYEDPSDYVEAGKDENWELDEDNERIKVKGNWKYFSDSTIVVDLGAENGDKPDPALATWKDIKGEDDINANVYFDGSELEYVLVWGEDITSAKDGGVYFDYFKDSDGTWAEFFVNGEFVTKKFKDKDQAGSLLEGAIYEVKISTDGKVEFIQDTVVERVYAGQVAEDGVSTSANTVKVKDIEFKITKDTMIVDMDAEEIGDVYDLDDEQFVLVLQKDEEEGIAEVIVILDIDEWDDFEKGGVGGGYLSEVNKQE